MAILMALRPSQATVNAPSVNGKFSIDLLDDHDNVEYA